MRERLLIRYGVSAAFVLLATLFRIATSLLWGRSMPFLAYFPAVMLSSWFGGLGPGLFATLLSAVALGVDWWMPGHQFPLSDLHGGAGLVMFVLVGFGSSALSEGLHRARVRAEEEAHFAREATERLRVAQMSAGVAVWNWRVPEDELYWSDDYYEMVGLPHSLRPCYANWLSSIHEDDRVKFKSELERLLSDPKRDRFELMFRVKHGDSAVRWLCALGRIERGSNGEALRVGGVTLDVTAYTQARTALRESEERLQATIDNVSALVYLKDRDGRYLLVNHHFEEVFGLGRGEALGRTDFELFDVSLAEVHRSHDLSVLLTGDAQRFDEVARHRDGELRDYMSIKFPLRRSDGETYAVGGVSADVTDSKRAEQVLREASRAKDEFLAMLSHELRNPLNAIANAVAMLERMPAGEPLLQKIKSVMSRQVRHLDRLLDDLLDVTRAATGKIVLSRRELNFSGIVDSCLATLRGSGRFEHHDVSADLEEVWVNGDPTRLEQIVSNLVINAVKYTPKGGKVRIRARKIGPEAVFRIEDTGVGISQDLLPHIFDLFVQGERSIDRAQGGLGIGLTLVRRLVELHGGKVEVSSAGLGKGSAFTVKLGAIERPLSAGVALPPSVPEPRRILLVEDHLDSREMLRELLEALGHDVHEAADGHSAVTEALAWHPDVIFLDVGLPGIDGYEAARRIRSGGGDMKLVALTGYGQKEDIDASRDAGFDVHLVKPIDPEELVDILSDSRSQAEFNAS